MKYLGPLYIAIGLITFLLVVSRPLPTCPDQDRFSRCMIFKSDETDRWFAGIASGLVWPIYWAGKAAQAIRGTSA